MYVTCIIIGLWSYLLSVDIRPGFYDEIVSYLNTLCQLCSVGNVLGVFFPEATTSSLSYEEQWNEVNRKRYQVCACVCVRGATFLFFIFYVLSTL